MPIKDLSKLNPYCIDCIKNYKKKHDIDKWEDFDIQCDGIPKEYLPKDVLDKYTDPDAVLSFYDPVIWAAKYLDWYCEDPDGEVWKMLTITNRLPSKFLPYDAELAAKGKSPFNREYQSLLLRCSSKYRVVRMGRQSGKTEVLCILILFSIYTNKDFPAVIITPQNSQISMIFNRLDQYISKNPALANSIKRNVKAPNYEIRLHNGSSILGFSAGTKSNNDALGARGQGASLLIFDEADYLSAADLNATLALITNFPRSKVYMSSTPTGKRQKFYSVCLHIKDYKEFHYPASVNPMYDEKLDAFFRREYTEQGYIAEALAEFPELEQGVFNIRFVKAAQDKFEYGDYHPMGNWIYSIGVDWNDTKVGTTIIVVGWDPSNRMFYVVDRHIISVEGWTLTTAVNKIIELNQQWVPDFIYVDRGYGSAQIELIKQFGIDAMGKNEVDARLTTVFHEYDFGSSVETIDPFTKQKLKKPAKPFLIENAVRSFERGVIRFPKSDDKLYQSLISYIIERVTESGVPKYGTNNEKVGDHLLDALALALIGFTMEKSPFLKAVHNPGIEMTTKNIFKPVSNLSRTIANMKDRPERSDLSNGNIVDKPKIIYSGWSRDEPPPKPKRSRRTRHSKRRLF